MTFLYFLRPFIPNIYVYITENKDFIFRNFLLSLGIVLFFATVINYGLVNNRLRKMLKDTLEVPDEESLEEYEQEIERLEKISKKTDRQAIVTLILISMIMFYYFYFS